MPCFEKWLPTNRWRLAISQVNLNVSFSLPFSPENAEETYFIHLLL